MEERNFFVYVHINKINNKKYIGITSRIKAKYRWGKNGNGYSNCTYFKKAINKYGWNNFEHIILFDKLTKQEALKIETKLIKKYKTNNSKFGYNGTTGGEFPNIREETLVKKHYSMLGKNQGKNSGIAKSVICLETNNIYDSINIAENELGIDRSSIIRVCKGKQYTAGNLHWMYLEDYNNSTEDYIKNKLQSYPIKSKSGIKKQILCLNNNKVYNSIKEASEDLNLNPKRISDVVNNKQSNTKGYKFILFNIDNI